MRKLSSTRRNKLTKLSEPITSEFSDKTIRETIQSNVRRPTNNRIAVEMSSGPSYPVICLMVNEFSPSRKEFLELKFVASQADEAPKRWDKSYSPPIGVFELSPESLDKSLLQHIEEVTNSPRNIEECHSGDTWIVAFKIFEIINGYRKATGKAGNVCYYPSDILESYHAHTLENEFLDQACQLNSMQFFMSRFIKLTSASAESVLHALQLPAELPYASDPIMTAALVDLQLKQAMQPLQKTATENMLKRLENLIFSAESKTMSCWIDCFCGVVILCLCIEARQVAGDHLTSTSLLDGEELKAERIEKCRFLDEMVYERVKDLFHCKFISTGPSKYETMNPLREGSEREFLKEETKETLTFVKEIRKIMHEHGEFIE